MSREVSHFKIGVFVIICLALITGVLIWLGLAYFFEDTKTYATYLDESVKGLQEDAVINYRGISVGRVESIRLAPDGRLIEIRMGLRTDFDVADFMVVQVRQQGLTGLQYLEIDSAPKNIDELTPELTFSPEYPVIPAIPSELEQLKTALEVLYGKVMDLEFGESMAAFTKAAQSSTRLMDRVTDLIGEKDVEKSLKNLKALLESTRDIAAVLETQFAGLPPKALPNLQARINKTAALAQDLFMTLDQQLGESSVLMAQTLEQLNRLVVQLNTLVESIQQQPSRLLVPSKQEDPFDER
ncbi:MAG: MlaD family protein [Desulfobacterales bacterium]